MKSKVKYWAGIAVVVLLATMVVALFIPEEEDEAPVTTYTIECEDANGTWTFEVVGDEVFQDGELVNLTPEAAEAIVWCER